MLSKFRKYESKLISFSKLLNKEKVYMNFWKNMNHDKGLCSVMRGYKRFIGYFLLKYPSTSTLSWCMGFSALKGRKDLVNFFIQRGAAHWGLGMSCSAYTGRANLIDLFISKSGVYETDLFWSLGRATEGNHKNLMNYFIAKITNYRSSDIWRTIIKGAEKGGNNDIVKYYRKKLNN